MKTFTNSTTYRDTKYECMQEITTDAKWAYWYALDILKKRWADIGKPEVENVIKKSSNWKYYKWHFNI